MGMGECPQHLPHNIGSLFLRSGREDFVHQNHTAFPEMSRHLPDVHQFPGHIACDSASNSEIVVPIRADGKIVGVLDLDSPRLGRFKEEDQAGLEELVRILGSEGWTG